MIKQIDKYDLPTCLEVIHKGYETVAIQFGLTEENCPDRGRASLPQDKLESEFENGTLMFGYFLENKIIGYLSMKVIDKEVCKLNDIVVLPQYRKKGYGQELIEFCKVKAHELGAKIINLGMIDDNDQLKYWYISNGFFTIGYKKFDKAPFTVEYMQCTI